MAVAYDTAAAATGLGVTSLSVNLTATGANRAAKITVSWYGAAAQTVTALTVNGSSSGVVTTSTQSHADGSRFMNTYYILAPPTSSVAYTAAFSAAVDECCIQVVSMTGVDQTTPVGTDIESQGNDTNPVATSVSSATNELAVGSMRGFYPAATVTAGGGQTSRIENESWSGGSDVADSSTIPGATTVSFSWTVAATARWLAHGISFKEAGGATNTNIQPSAGAAAFTGYSPTVTTTGAQTRQPSAGAMALAGIASTLTLTLPAPDSGALGFTGYAPTVTVTNTQTRQPSAGSLSFTGYAPTVTNTSSRNMTPVTGTLTFVGYAPTVTIYIPTRQPTAGEMAFTGYAPSVSINSPNSGASQQRNRRKRGMLNMIWGR